MHQWVERVVKYVAVLSLLVGRGRQLSVQSFQLQGQEDVHAVESD